MWLLSLRLAKIRRDTKGTTPRANFLLLHSPPIVFLLQKIQISIQIRIDKIFLCDQRTPLVFRELKFCSCYYHLVFGHVVWSVCYNCTDTWNTTACPADGISVFVFMRQYSEDDFIRATLTAYWQATRMNPWKPKSTQIRSTLYSRTMKIGQP